MTTKTLDLNNIEQKIFWTLLSLFGIVAAFYLYSMVTLTVAVVDRNNATKAAHQLAKNAGALEAEYLAQTNLVTLAYAENIGLYEVTTKYAGERNARFSLAR